MLSSEANEMAEKDAKKTIACEHITKALEELGFGEYVPELQRVAEAFKGSQVVSYALIYEMGGSGWVDCGCERVDVLTFWGARRGRRSRIRLSSRVCRMMS